MRLALTLRRSQSDSTDVLVEADPAMTVGSLAEQLHARDPHRIGPRCDVAVTIAIRDSTGQLTALPAGATLARSGIFSGATVTIVPGTGELDPVVAEAARLHVIAGPMAGNEISLPYGTHSIGRHQSSTIQLNDPRVSGDHARLIVGTAIEIVDHRSSNGVILDGNRVDRAVLGPEDIVVLGNTSVTVTRTESAGRSGGVVAFDRPPRIETRYKGAAFIAPALPSARGWRLPVLVVLAPLLVGAAYFAWAQSPVALVLVSLSPLLLLAAWVESRLTRRPSLERATADFLAQVAELDIALREASERERRSRLDEQPGLDELTDAAHRRTSLLWTRRPEHESFLAVRLGLGAQASRATVRMPTEASAIPRLWQSLVEVAERHASIPDVPVLANPRQDGAIGVAGVDAIGVARSLLLQYATLHSPAEVVIAAAITPAARAEWDWLKWLPHTGSRLTPLAGAHLVDTSPAVAHLIESLHDLVTARLAGTEPEPAVVVLVDDAVDTERARLIELAERGPAASVHIVWIATSADRLPAACRTFVEVRPDAAAAGFVHWGERVAPLRLEPVDVELANTVARQLCPLVDSSARAWPSHSSTIDIVELPFGLGRSWLPVGRVTDRVTEDQL